MEPVKKNQFKLIMLFMAIITFSSCNDDDITQTVSSKHDLLICTLVDESSYVGTIKNLGVGEMTNTNSWEHVLAAAPFIYGDMVFIAENYYGDVVYKYIRSENGMLDKAGSITLPAAANGTVITFVNETKAYISLLNNGTLYVFNPTSLEYIETINLTEYGVGDSNPDPCSSIIRDGKLYVALSQVKGSYSAYDSAYVAIIDIETNTVDKVITDSRVTSLRGHYNRDVFMDENKDIYFYSTGVWDYQDGANDGLLRIKNGETEFDPDYYFSPKSVTVDGIDGNVSYTMVLTYAGNGKAYASFMIPAWTSNPPDYINDKNYQPICVDIYNKTLTKLDLPPTIGYSCFGIVEYNDTIIYSMSTAKGDGLYTYAPSTGESSESPVVTTVGIPMFLNVFED